MMDEKGDMYSPLMVSDFVVYKLPLRPIREHCHANAPWGCRLGPHMRGSLTQRMIRPKFVSPAARKVSPREIAQVLENPDQVGYPASTNTDACLGKSDMGYQSWDAVYGHCEAWKWTLVRLEGRLSKGNDGKAKDGICQKAKVGYCPCCTRATLVAIPQSYAIRAMDPSKHVGIRLWAAFRPWAPRRLAAIGYSMRYINSYPLPTGWDWAAKSLDIQAPEPIIRGTRGGEPIVIRAISQTHDAHVLRPKLPRPKEPKKVEEPPIVNLPHWPRSTRC